MFPTMKGDDPGTARPSDRESAHGPVAFELTNLSKLYQRGKGSAVRAVDGLNLSVPAGQVIGLLGPNGAGKTTTIKMMCGLVTPTSGRVRLHGYDVARERPMAVRQVGAVLEGARNVY
jgi:ABC-2 type transport system ATP-binding protein